MQRTILVILSNRFNPTHPGRFFELKCLDDGTVKRETQLKSRPKKAVYDEVWENEDGRTSLDSCTRMKRHYKHALIKKAD